MARCRGEEPVSDSFAIEAVDAVHLRGWVWGEVRRSRRQIRRSPHQIFTLQTSISQPFSGETS